MRQLNWGLVLLGLNLLIRIRLAVSIDEHWLVVIIARPFPVEETLVKVR
jgi:hypothetical protein